MLNAGLRALLAFVILFATGSPFIATAKDQPPNFEEVYNLVRSNLVGISDAELNQAAVRALLSALNHRARLVTAGNEAFASADGTVTRSNLFDGQILYLRLGQIEKGAAQGFQEAFKHYTTNKLNGVVLDLRMANGDDYRAAAELTDLFVEKDQPLVDWGEGMFRSSAKGSSLQLPVAVLVNNRTAGASELLAALLRHYGSALLIGGKTAGQAMLARNFSLSNGDRLLIGTAPIKLADGSTIPLDGLKPDIEVATAPERERAWMEDPFRNLDANTAETVSGGSNTGTNRVRRSRFNEAELVRERREGTNLEPELRAARPPEPEKPVVRDPVLARGLDLLKGLTVVRKGR